MKPSLLLFFAMSGIGLRGAQIGMIPPPARNNPFEAVPDVPESPRVTGAGPAIAAIEFRGAARMPRTLLRAITVLRAGDAYDAEAVRRDGQALYDTGRFSRVAWEVVPEPAGVAVRFQLFERALIRSIVLRGDGPVGVAEIVERFRERKVKMLVESLYRDDELERAVAVVQELLDERGRSDIVVTASVEPIAPAGSVQVAFQVEKKR